MVESHTLNIPSQQATKRKVSSMSTAEKPHRPVKRRASKACQCCRARKVRCNVVEHGAPCTNCRLDEVDCIVTESKRRRKTITKPLEEQDAKQRCPDSILDGLLSLQTPSHHGGSSRSGSEDHVSHPLYRTHSRHLAAANDMQLRHSFSLSNAATPYWTDGQNSPQGSGKRFHGLPSGVRDGTGTMYPKYLKPLPSNMALEDIAFLERAGAFTLPPVSLRNELIQYYIEFVHPFLPILELQYSLDTIARGDGTLGQISLLVLQSLMFTAASFVKQSSLRRAGYKTREEARTKFFKKAKLLYHFDADLDRFSQIQALLLITFAREASGEGKDAWHWLGNTVNTALSIGLNRSSTYPNLMTERRHLYKRAWWSCVILDRSLALGLQRPPHLKAHDFDTSMITMDEFELDVSPLDRSFSTIECSNVKRIQTQRFLASLFIERAKLSICMERILLKSDSAQNELESWKNGLPKELTIERHTSPIDRANVNFFLQKALLHLAYASTVTCLEPGALQLPSPQSETTPVRLEAEISMCSIQRILNQEFVRYLPSPCAQLLRHGLDVQDRKPADWNPEPWRSCIENLALIETSLTEVSPSMDDALMNDDGKPLCSAPDFAQRPATPLRQVSLSSSESRRSMSTTFTTNPTMDALRQHSSLSMVATPPESDHGCSAIEEEHRYEHGASSSFDANENNDNDQQTQIDETVVDRDFFSFINLDDPMIDAPSIDSDADNNAVGAVGAVGAVNNTIATCTWHIDQMKMAPDGCVIKSEQQADIRLMPAVSTAVA